MDILQLSSQQGTLFVMILAGVVLFAFLGTCYWLMFGKF